MTKPYQDVEVALLDWLDQYVAASPLVSGITTYDAAKRYVDTQTPSNLQDVLPFFRLSLVTGSDNGVTDYSVVDLDVFADSRDAAYALSEDIRSRLTGRSHRIGTFRLDRVLTEEKPRRLPWEDTNIRRYGATYRVSARR